MEDNRGLSYFFLGLGIGAAVGILFAPQAGSETRGLIRTKAKDSGDYLRRRSEELRDQAGELVHRGKEVVSRQREQITAAVDAGRQAYRESVSGAGERESPEGV